MRRTASAFATAIIVALAAGAPLGGARAAAASGIFKRYCAACHDTRPGKVKIGPSLAGIVGRRAGSEPGFNYSAAMRKSGVTWSMRMLDRYLTAPQTVIPGTKMSFIGVKDPEARHALVEYLATLKGG